jgi:hypothetical protein
MLQPCFRVCSQQAIASPTFRNRRCSSAWEHLWPPCTGVNACRLDRNDVLGRYHMSTDPCKPARASRQVHMHNSIQALLERSAREQGDEVGHKLDLTGGDGEGGDGEEDDDAASARLASALRRTLRSEDDAQSTRTKEENSGNEDAQTKQSEEERSGDEADEEEHGSDDTDEGESEQEPPGGAFEDQTVAKRTIAADDWVNVNGETFWRTRPMIMHKVRHGSVAIAAARTGASMRMCTQAALLCTWAGSTQSAGVAAALLCCTMCQHCAATRLARVV